MFVTADDFNLIPYNIPNLQQVANTFPLYVEAKERVILVKLLGLQLYTDFVAGLNALPPQWQAAPAKYDIDEQVVYGASIWKSLIDDNRSEPVEGTDWTKVEDNKWLTLKLGTTYGINSVASVWVGMKRMLVPYIYSVWLRDTFDSHSGVGIVEAKAENSAVKSPAIRIVRAFNEFAMIAGTSDNAFDYDAYDNDTLAAFINASNTLTPGAYPNWCFTDVATMNTFGI